MASFVSKAGEGCEFVTGVSAPPPSRNMKLRRSFVDDDCRKDEDVNDLDGSPVRTSTTPSLNFTTSKTKLASPLNGFHDRSCRQIYVQSTLASSSK